MKVTFTPSKETRKRAQKEHEKKKRIKKGTF